MNQQTCVSLRHCNYEVTGPTISVEFRWGGCEWQASYSGDSTNSPSASHFGPETEIVVPRATIPVELDMALELWVLGPTEGQGLVVARPAGGTCTQTGPRQARRSDNPKRSGFWPAGADVLAVCRHLEVSVPTV
jgi:hypothetical protein